jgi:23S rRNA pseudouridine2457 synthase
MNTTPHRYFVINKPYDMESQFVSPYPGLLLGDLNFDFPEGTHAVGRLDKHSEGLLLLTTNKKITTLLFESKVPHKRTYLVQVKHKMTTESLDQLRTGVSIKLRGGGGEYTTPPCEVQIVEEPKDIFPSPRNFPPYIVSTWLLMTLTEGRYRQVRKMVAAVRHRCMRLIRVSIEDLSLGNLEPGAVREIPEDLFFEQLKLDRSSI